MIKELIVVEGKNDSARLRSFFDCETIETSGLGLSRETVAFIKEINAKRGVILLLDPDTPGEKIRKRLNDEIAGLKNAFLMKEDARTAKKVGVEHASREVLEEALDNLVTFCEQKKEELKMSDLFECGLSGTEGAEEKRDRVSRKYHIGKCNAKTLCKRLNMLGITKEELLKI